MKKIYLFFVILLCCGLTIEAQTITPEMVNFTQLAEFEIQHPELKPVQHGEPDGGWKMLMPDMPFPPGANIKRQPPYQQRPTNPATPLTASPPPNKTFLGHIDPSQTIPPDTHGAVGLNHVVTATNDFIRIHAKDGTVISNVTFAAFTGFTGGSSDPYVIYDHVANRWYMSAIDVSVNTGNRVMLAVSQTNDPTGNWFRFRFVPNVPSGSFLLDHPYMGFDDRWIVISGRKFPSGAGFSGPILFIFDKANVLSSSPIAFGTSSAQAIEKTTTDGDAPLPVTLFGTNPSPNTFYIMQSWSGTASSIRLSTVTGNLPTATWNTTAAVFPAGGSPWAFSPGSVAEQLGETRKLATNDSRISSGVMVNGNIWCCHHVGMSPTNVAVQWWQVNGNPGAAFGSVIQRGRIGDGQPNSYRWFPSIAVNPFEDVLIGYTYSTNTTRVSAAYSFRSNLTPLNTTDDQYIYKTGLNTYYKDFGGARARWGDYSHTAVDPSDASLWTVQEYADQRTGSTDNDSRYGVWWAQVTPASTLLKFDAAIGAIIEPVSGLLCNLPVNPSVTIRNLGTDTLKTVLVGMILDGVPWGTVTRFTGLNIPTFANSRVIALSPSFSPTPGLHTFKVFTQKPNDSTDLRPRNDTATVTFTVATTLNLPYTESFETLPFPPANGSAVINPDAPARTWTRTTLAGNPGTASMRVNCFNYGPDAAGNLGQRDIYRTPKLNIDAVDSLVITFNVAHRQYFGTDVTDPVNDSLNVVYSPDCGITWFPTGYAKGSATLSTVPGTSNQNFVPTGLAQWRRDRAVLKDICGKGLRSVMIGFETVNAFGNNIYVDGINIVAFNSVANNAFLQSINQPISVLCATTVTPDVTFSNAGQDTLRSLKINYTIDNGPVVTFNWSGVLAKCGVLNATLPSSNTSAGTHLLTVYTSDPNGVADQAPSNDRLTKVFSAYVPAATPIFEGFEGTTFPSDNWGVLNLAGGGTTYERSTRAAKTGVGSMLMNNPNSINVTNSVDYFISPIVINSQSFDSMYVDFDMSYKSGPQYPGSTVFPLDTLEVWATFDCGATFKPIWKKFGYELQTVNDPSYSYLETPFMPKKQIEWRKERVYLTPYVGKDNNFQLYFVTKGNKQNNLWIDNINIRSQVLPQKLKDQGYLIYPNPFNNTFLIHHSAVEPPVDLQSAQVFNAAGQLVWDRRYNGNAERQITVNMKDMASGVYVLKMIYTNKTVVERIVKTRL